MFPELSIFIFTFKRSVINEFNSPSQNMYGPVLRTFFTVIIPLCRIN